MNNHEDTKPTGEPDISNDKTTRTAYTVLGRIKEISHYGKSTDRAVFLTTATGAKAGGKLLLRDDSEISETDLFNDPAEFIDRKVSASIVQVGSDYSIVCLRRANGNEKEFQTWYSPW